MKIPRMTAGDGAENIVGFEVELQILPALTGPHVPRFVAAGDLHRLPYITMEYLQGHTLQHWLDAPARASGPTKNSSPAWAPPWPTRCTACTSKTPATSTSSPATCSSRTRPCRAAGLWPVVPRALPRPAGRRAAQGRGLARVDGARASGGRARRPAQRHLRHWRDAVRAGHGRAAVWRPHHHGRHAPAPVDGARPAAQAPARPGPVAAGNHPALPGARSRAPLPLGRPPGPGPGQPHPGAHHRARAPHPGHAVSHPLQALAAGGGHALPAQPAALAADRGPPSSWWPCRTAM
jgi:hypothetical protein